MIYYKLCCNPMRFIRNCLFLNGSSQKYKEDSFREKKILQNQKNNFIHHNSTALLCDTTANFGSRNQYNANGKYTSTEHACGKYTCGKHPCRKQTCGKHTCGKYACRPPCYRNSYSSATGRIPAANRNPFHGCFQCGI